MNEGVVVLLDEVTDIFPLFVCDKCGFVVNKSKVTIHTNKRDEICTGKLIRCEPQRCSVCGLYHVTLDQDFRCYNCGHVNILETSEMRNDRYYEWMKKMSKDGR